jgi:hypothetical protein
MSNPWLHQVEAERICAVHAVTDRNGCLASSEPFDVLHHHRERQAPGRDFHGTPVAGIQIDQELIVIAGAELGVQSNVEVAFGAYGLRRSHGYFRNGQ